MYRKALGRANAGVSRLSRQPTASSSASCKKYLHQTKAASQAAAENVSTAATTTASPAQGYVAPSSKDVDAYMVQLERKNMAKRAGELALLSRAATSVAREADSLPSLPRQLAHLLLVKDVLSSSDIANPASLWQRSYSDLEAERIRRDYGRLLDNDVQAVTENVKVLSPQEQQDILNSMTQASAKAGKFNDVSPPIGGALSNLAGGEVVTGKGEGVNAVSVLYVDTLCDYLSVIAERASAFAASASEVAKETEQLLKAANVHVETADATIRALTSADACLTSAQSEFVSNLNGAQLVAFSKRLIAAKRGQLFSGAKDRLEKVQKSMQLLRDARNGKFASGSAKLPTVATVHAMLEELVGAGVSGFTESQSAAAANAAEIQTRLQDIQGHLNAMAAHTAKVSNAQAPTYTVEIPSIASILSAPGYEVDKILVKESGSNTVLPFLVTPSGGFHHARIAAGHIPSMLSPLMKVLTPSEWKAAVALVRTTLPSLSNYLSHPAGSVADNMASSAAAKIAAAAAAAQNEDRVLVTMQAAGVHPSANAVNPTGASNSALNTLAGPVTEILGHSSTNSSQTIRTMIEQAPSEDARREYIAYLMKVRTARTLLSQQREITAAAQDAVARLSATAGPEAAAALQAKLAADIRALEDGSRIMDEEEMLSALARAQSLLTPAEKKKLTGDAAIEVRQALIAMLEPHLIASGNLRGTSSIFGAGLPDWEAIHSLLANSETASYGAIAAKNKFDQNVDTTLGSVQYYPSSAKAAPVDSAAGAFGAATGAISPALALPSASNGSVVTHLGQEDAGGIVDRESAVMAAGVLEVGPAAWPPVPRIAPFHLSFVANRVAANGDAAQLAATTQELITRNQNVAAVDPMNLVSSITAAGTPAPKAPNAPIPTLATVPKTLVNAEAIAKEGVGASFAAPDINRSLRLGAMEAEIENKKAQRAAAASGTGLTDPSYNNAKSATDIDGPWDSHCYEVTGEYRNDEAYGIIHERLLEAMEAKDLNAMWLLWSEHCRMVPQNGAPDVLALEIMMDGCSRAKRADLVFNVLWPLAVNLRIVPTPHMQFLLLKAASLAGDVASTRLALNLFKSSKKNGEAIEDKHYAAAISACLAIGDNKQAVELFNNMRRDRISPPVDIYGALFTAFRGKENAANAAAVWRSLIASPSVKVPGWLYTNIIETLAEGGNLQDMEEARRRMSRKIDGKLSPSPRALAAMFEAYAKTKDAAKATRVYNEMVAFGYIDDGSLPGDEIKAILQVLGKAQSPDKKKEVVLEEEEVDPTNLLVAVDLDEISDGDAASDDSDDEEGTPVVGNAKKGKAAPAVSDAAFFDKKNVGPVLGKRVQTAYEKAKASEKKMQ